MTRADDLVPISDLFFDGPGPHVVRAGFPPTPAFTPRFTPARGQELRALLNTSIVQLGAVSGETRRKTPQTVSIETLVYRGRAALERALEVREEIVARGTSDARVEELLDLVALAATD